MTRFNCPEYVDAWKDGGKFPNIHNGIFNLIARGVKPEDGNILDLGSSTGLLSRRLADAGYTVYPMEASRVAIAEGTEAGVYDDLEVTQFRLRPSRIPEFIEWLSKHHIKVVVARRVFPELDDSGIPPVLMTEAFIAAGVEHLFVEGRVPRANVKHRLHNLRAEIDALGLLWSVADVDLPHRAHLVSELYGARVDELDG